MAGTDTGSASTWAEQRSSPACSTISFQVVARAKQSTNYEDGGPAVFGRIVTAVDEVLRIGEYRAGGRPRDGPGGARPDRAAIDGRALCPKLELARLRPGAVVSAALDVAGDRRERRSHGHLRRMEPRSRQGSEARVRRLRRNGRWRRT